MKRESVADILHRPFSLYHCGHSWFLEDTMWQLLLLIVQQLLQHIGGLLFPPLMETRNACKIYNSRSRFFQIIIICAFGKIITKLVIFKPYIRISPVFKLCHFLVLYKPLFQMSSLSSLMFPPLYKAPNTSQMIVLLGKSVQRGVKQKSFTHCCLKHHPCFSAFQDSLLIFTH